MKMGKERNIPVDDCVDVGSDVAVVWVGVVCVVVVSVSVV